jgi:hypothetical protein
VKGIVVGMRGGSLFENEAFYSASQLARAALTVTGCGDSRSMRPAPLAVSRMPRLCSGRAMAVWAVGLVGEGRTREDEKRETRARRLGSRAGSGVERGAWAWSVGVSVPPFRRQTLSINQHRGVLGACRCTLTERGGQSKCDRVCGEL